MAKKGQKFTKYSPEFKLSVILDMREHKLSYSETMRKYFPYLAGSKDFGFLKVWERIYLEEVGIGRAEAADDDGGESVSVEFGVCAYEAAADDAAGRSV